MKVAYFDTFAGISGDMTLGAFLHAGVPLEYLRSNLAALPMSRWSVETAPIVRSAIHALKAHVRIEGHDAESASHRGEHDHGRTLSEILAMLDASKLPDRVRERATAIFRVIGEAEAKIHDTAVEKVHFHEVGAVDSIIDIVGSCVCLEYFGVETVYSSPLRLGSGGTIATRHGVMPIPAPATAEILRGYPTLLTDIPYELTTPTGAGIIKALSAGQLAMEQFTAERVGYGAGTKEIPQVPNLLRVFIGTLAPRQEQDELVTVETNIDNMNPEIYPHVIEQLLSAGAHDAYLVPVIMKKGRPGMLLSVLVNRGKIDPVLSTVFSETTTLGVRIQPVERRKVKRESRTIATSFGDMRVKAILVDGRERLAPEFEECRRIASERHIPLIEVYRRIESELSSRSA